MSNPHHTILLVVDSAESLLKGIHTLLMDFPVSCKCHFDNQQTITLQQTLCDVYSLPPTWMPAVEHFAKTCGPNWALLYLTLFELAPNTTWPEDPSIFYSMTKQQFCHILINSLHTVGSLIDIDGKEHCLQIDVSCS